MAPADRRYEFDIKQRPSNVHGVKRQYQLMLALPICPSPYALTRKVTTRKWTANTNVVQDDADSDEEPPHYATTEEFRMITDRLGKPTY